MKKIYYDHAATTKQLKEVTQAVTDTIENNWYNVSSGYTPSFEAGKIVSNAQKAGGRLINCNPQNILFTSGATESNNMVLRGLASLYDPKDIHIITSQIEHPAVYETLSQMKKAGVEVSFVKVDEGGRVNPKDIEKAIRPNTRLISIMFVNNETGVIQPIEEIGELAKKRNILFHTDAVQALGHLKIDVEKLGIDFLTGSGHKMYGPKGVGLLYVKDFKSLKPFMYGGGQQKNMRSGTINNEGIAGFKVALEYAYDMLEADNERLKELRDYVETSLLENLPGTLVNGDYENRISTTTNLSFPNIEAESLIMMLDMKGIYVSGGSACATGKGEPSRILTAMGLSSERAKGAIRFSFGRENTMEEAVEAVKTVTETVKYLQSVRL